MSTSITGFERHFWEFENRLPLKIEPDAMGDLLLSGRIVDGRAGGLVLGRRHDENLVGGIYIIRTTPEGFVILRENMEGGEFVVNANSSRMQRERLEAINQWKEGTGELPPLPVTPILRVLSVSAEPFDKLLWLELGQFIVNRRATAAYFNEIHELNRTGNLHLSCDLAIALSLSGS